MVTPAEVWLPESSLQPRCLQESRPGIEGPNAINTPIEEADQSVNDEVDKDELPNQKVAFQRLDAVGKARLEMDLYLSQK